MATREIEIKPDIVNNVTFLSINVFGTVQLWQL